MKNSKLLFIGPIPPPVDGQSKATLATLDSLSPFFDSIILINTNRSGLSRNFASQMLRIGEILRILFKLLIQCKNYDMVYMSVAESKLGNTKDILILFILHRFLKNTILQILGGSGIKSILDSKSILSKINRYIYQRIKFYIVEGDFQLRVLEPFVNNKSLLKVNNFYDQYLLVDSETALQRFANLKKIRILYLSNMIYEKGYQDLLDAYLLLSSDSKNCVNLTFVGGFQVEHEKKLFLNKITPLSGVEYLGAFVDGYDKRDLYLSNHIFCLPTYYPYEGQPISILEAYATGCVVITTPHAGIPDIFTNGYNGYQVTIKSPRSIANQIEMILRDKSELPKIAYNNISDAKMKYTRVKYLESIRSGIFK